jgi:diguanylate cyclase (GGDEF)-like protein
VFTFPLGQRESLLGALDLYRDTPGPLTAEEMHAAQTLADVAAAYLLNSQSWAELTDAAARFRHSSLHDELTGLPNRALFLERLDHAVQRARRSHRLVAVLYADLDRFKMINDLHGHSVGDELLVAFSGRLTAELRPGDTLARLSGDEFVVLCEDIRQPEEASRIVDRLDHAMLPPFTLSGVEVKITASVGVTFAGAGYDVHGEDILRQADSAMYEAKRTGGGRHVVAAPHPFAPDEDLRLAIDLQYAVARNELALDYQPIIVGADATVVGVEALARWHHPRRGLIAPGVFIPFAERDGLVGPIGSWVLRQACTDLADWGRRSPDRPLKMSVNVSALQLSDPTFSAAVESILTSTHTAAASIILEVTETVFILDGKRAMATLNDLKDLGVALALDDFGTGFSSLSHLNRFPVDIVKIDRSFVSSPTTTNATRIVSAIVALAHALGMTSTAEGVETALQHRAMLDAGVDACQGYHFARPMTSPQIAQLLRQSKTRSEQPTEHHASVIK